MCTLCPFQNKIIAFPFFFFFSLSPSKRHRERGKVSQIQQTEKTMSYSEAETSALLLITTALWMEASVPTTMKEPVICLFLLIDCLLHFCTDRQILDRPQFVIQCGTAVQMEMSSEFFFFLLVLTTRVTVMACLQLHSVTLTKQVDTVLTQRSHYKVCEQSSSCPAPKVMFLRKDWSLSETERNIKSRIDRDFQCIPAWTSVTISFLSVSWPTFYNIWLERTNTKVKSAC